jgi:hypothetical protein
MIKACDLYNDFVTFKLQSNAKNTNYLFEHKTLNRQEAEEILTNIASNTYSSQK